MKLNRILALMIVGVLLFVTSVSAVPGIAVSNVVLGGSSQDRDTNVTAAFTVTNTGSPGEAAVEVTAVTTAADVKYKVEFLHPTNGNPVSTSNPLIVQVGVPATVTVKGFIPIDFNSVDTGLEAKAFSIGLVSVSGKVTGTTTTVGPVTADLTMQAKNMLNLKKGKVIVSGASSKEKTFRSGTKVEDIKPGDHLTIELEVENLFSERSSTLKNTDINFDDVEVTLEFDNDEDFDVDETTDSMSIDAGEEETVSFKVDVEDDARDRAHTLDIFIDGVDENGARHGEKVRISINIERDPHDIVIKSAEVQPNVIVCGGDRNLRVDARVTNRGRLDEDEVVVEASIPTMGLLQKTPAFSLDEDDSKNVNFVLTVDDDAKPGTYAGNVFTYYDISNKNNFRPLTLVIEECKKPEATPTPTPEPTQPPTPEATPTPAPVVVTQPPTGNGVVVSRRPTFDTTELVYIVALGALIFIVLALLIVLAAKAVSRKD